MLEDLMNYHGMSLDEAKKKKLPAIINGMDLRGLTVVYLLIGLKRACKVKEERLQAHWIYA